MSYYHRETRAYLDRTFTEERDGLPLTHQPVFGLGPDRLQPHQLPAVVRTFAQLRVLARLDGESLLDVGAAEGWLAHLARELLGYRVAVTDLAAPAVLRTRRFFGHSGVACNAAALPFADDAFDVVICSEVLEHLEHPFACCHELVRVAAKHVFLTTECVYADPAARDRALDERADTPHEDLNHFVPADVEALLGGDVRTTAQMERLVFDVPATPTALADLMLELTGDLPFSAERYGAMFVRTESGAGWREPRVDDRELALALANSALDPARIDPNLGADPSFEAELRCPACPERPALESQAAGLLCPGCGTVHPRAEGGVPDFGEVVPPEQAHLIAAVEHAGRREHLAALVDHLRLDREVAAANEWRGAEIPAAWQLAHQLELADGALRCTGDDPILVSPRIALPQRELAGVEIEMASDRDGVGQVFWMTLAEPWFDEARSITFPVAAGETARVYPLMKAEGHVDDPDEVMTHLRLDPLSSEGRVRIERITLVRR